MSRSALRLGVLCLLLLAGAASSLLAAGPRAARATTATAAATVTNPSQVVLAVSGHGWGHGLGLSQWGAYGYAKHGWTYDRILAHYYSGTTLAPAKVSTVRVLLAQKKKIVLTSTAAWTVTDAAGTKVALDPGIAVMLGPELAVSGQTLVPPLAFTGKQPLAVDGRAFRGRIVVSSDTKRLQVVDVVGLEAYLKGVVPAEMPQDWPPQALEAQAVAARSYALANLTRKRDFDLYSDTRDQVYGGVAAESPAASDAITATKGEVVLYAGKVADTLFFSTSGGRTASSEETTGTAVPYLVSVPDPYDSVSPYHDWGPVLFDGRAVAKQLKLVSPLVGLTDVPGASGRVTSVTGVGQDDAQETVSGTQFRALLELRSTWFTSALLSLTAAAKTITYGGAVSLSGFARGADAVSLETKTASQDWSPAGELMLGTDGVFSTIVKPVATTQYRLVWGSVRAGLARVSVAPRIDARPGPAGVSGTERPAIAGSPVELQRQTGTLWSTVASTPTDAAGSWSFGGQLQPGTYRVRCAPGQGLAAGISAVFQVQ